MIFQLKGRCVRYGQDVKNAKNFINGVVRNNSVDVMSKTSMYFVVSSMQASVGPVTLKRQYITYNLLSSF